MIRTCIMLMMIAAAYACDNAQQDRPSEPLQGTAPLIELRVGHEEPEPGFQIDVWLTDDGARRLEDNGTPPIRSP